MLKDTAYSALMQDKRGYGIMLLREQEGKAFTDIAREYNISLERVRQIYSKQKFKQKCLYIHHIAIALGHENTSQIGKIFRAAEDWYRDRTYACAYFEKKYKDILTEYRDGEPGMPPQFIKSIPPFRSKLSKKEIARVVEMREVQKAPFALIAKELRITQAKAKHTYDWFYHERVVELVKALQDTVKTFEEKAAIWDRYFKGNITDKKCYDMLIKDTHIHNN